MCARDAASRSRWRPLHTRCRQSAKVRARRLLTSFPMNQWSHGPQPGYSQPSYPPGPSYPHPGYVHAQPNYPQPALQPAKKKFKFEMWMLGAVIVPIGLGIAVVSFMQRNSVEVGGSCSADEQCKKGDSGGVCSNTCSSSSDCAAGLACTSIKVTLTNQAGSHDLGPQKYCLKAKGTATKVSSAR
jgi:hypothetical protein